MGKPDQWRDGLKRWEGSKRPPSAVRGIKNAPSKPDQGSKMFPCVDFGSENGPGMGMLGAVLPALPIRMIDASSCNATT